MKRLALLLPLLAACSSPSPYVTTVGILRPGSTMTVSVGAAPLSAFQPAAGQPRRLFTISATALAKSSPPPPEMRAVPGGVSISAPVPLDSLLVRVPDGVDLVVKSRGGDVTVEDIGGNAQIEAARGNVFVTLPGYAQATVGQGNVTVTMGSTAWPGTLRFSSGRGDVTITVAAFAAFHAHLHTGGGGIVTDFGLTPTSLGPAQTIDGAVNGGGAHGIDVETSSGNIRLLRVNPQS